MADYKPYVAVQEFILNLNNGQKEVKATYGDLIEFDGLSVKIKDFEGQAPSFSKVVREGEWVKPIHPDKVSILKERLAGSSDTKFSEENTGPEKPRNQTAGKIVENSDVGSTRVVELRRSNKELQDIVNQYENETYLGEESEEIEESKESRIEDNLPEKRVNIIDDDASIVKKVSKEAFTSTSTKNTSGVELDDVIESPLKVVFNEERVVKDTSYLGEEEIPKGRKKLAVDYDSEGVVVKKTSVPAKNKSVVDKNTKVEEDSFEVTKEQEVVSETSYEKSKPIDVGSSTQVGVESIKKTSSSSKKGGRKALKVKKADLLEQDAVVVGKSSTPKDISTVDGITVKTSVGSNKETSGEAKFSSGGDGIESTGATFSGTDSPIVDLSGIEASDTFTESAMEVDGGDIDISDLLD